MSDENKIWALIAQQPVCMLASHDGEAIRSRPMHAMPDRESGMVWFFTDARAHKDEEVAANPHICLAFADTSANTYLSLSGGAEISNDRRRIEDMWNGGAAAFFPDGPDDPNIRLLGMRLERAEYWDGPSSSIVVAMKMAAARLSGERPDLGENKKLSLG